MAATVVVTLRGDQVPVVERIAAEESRTRSGAAQRLIDEALRERERDLAEEGRGA